MRERRCGTCDFWDLGSVDLGECRKRAPIADVARDGAARWPEVCSGEWCGEWQARDEPPEIHAHGLADIIHEARTGGKRKVASR